MEQEITLTRALVHLKRLDDRILSAIGKKFLYLHTEKSDGTGLVHGKSSLDLEGAKKEVQGNTDSVLKLIENRSEVKAALVRANAETKVVINGRSVTIAEAIELKNSVEYKKLLLNRLKLELAGVESTKEKFLISEEKSIAELIKTITDPVVLETVIRSSKSEITLVNQSKVEKVIEGLEKEVEAIESDLDQTLSEVNAITKIKVKLV